MILRWLEILSSCIFWVIYLSVTQHGLLSVCPSCTFSTTILLAALLVSPSRTALENEIIRKNEISALVPLLSFYLWLNSSARYLGPYSYSCLVLKVVPRDRILRKFKKVFFKTEKVIHKASRPLHVPQGENLSGGGLLRAWRGQRGGRNILKMLNHSELMKRFSSVKLG